MAQRKRTYVRKSRQPVRPKLKRLQPPPVRRALDVVPVARRGLVEHVLADAQRHGRRVNARHPVDVAVVRPVRVRVRRAVVVHVRHAARIVLVLDLQESAQRPVAVHPHRPRPVVGVDHRPNVRYPLPRRRAVARLSAVEHLVLDAPYHDRRMVPVVLRQRLRHRRHVRLERRVPVIVMVDRDPVHRPALVLPVVVHLRVDQYPLLVAQVVEQLRGRKRRAVTHQPHPVRLHRVQPVLHHLPVQPQVAVHRVVRVTPPVKRNPVQVVPRPVHLDLSEPEPHVGLLVDHRRRFHQPRVQPVELRIVWPPQRRIRPCVRQHHLDFLAGIHQRRGTAVQRPLERAHFRTHLGDLPDVVLDVHRVRHRVLVRDRYLQRDLRILHRRYHEHVLHVYLRHRVEDHVLRDAVHLVRPHRVPERVQILAHVGRIPQIVMIPRDHVQRVQRRVARIDEVRNVVLERHVPLVVLRPDELPVYIYFRRVVHLAEIKLDALARHRPGHLEYPRVLRLLDVLVAGIVVRPIVVPVGIVIAPPARNRYRPGRKRRRVPLVILRRQRRERPRPRRLVGAQRNVHPVLRVGIRRRQRQHHRQRKGRERGAKSFHSTPLGNGIAAAHARSRTATPVLQRRGARHIAERERAHGDERSSSSKPSGIPIGRRF